ncbi:MAG: hypothetical protein P4N24_15305 [Acidobacteriota bacterium]|nr:hypothetical protein [Acidobacteriota bacterium]
MSIEKTDSLVERLRHSYLAGNSISELIGGEACFREASPLEIMWKMMEAFHLGLGDVSCIDGWWPPGSNREVTDENLDLFIRDAIEKHRSAWEPTRE